MLRTLLVLAHFAGALALGIAIVGALAADARARRAERLHALRDALRRAALLEQRVAGPAAMVLLASGAALTALFYGGWDALRVPWLGAMLLLFALEGLRANTLSRRRAARLEALAARGAPHARVCAELADLMHAWPTRFARVLTLPVFLLIVALGAFRPQTWTAVALGAVVAVLVAALAAALGARAGVSPASAASRASVDDDADRHRNVGRSPSGQRR